MFRSLQIIIREQVCTSLKLLNALYCTTRITTYTYCTYCCHNTEIDRQDFKFSVFKNF